jgi:hypothetical protein
MTRLRIVLVLLATAVSAAACAAPSIDSIEDEIVVPKRVSGGTDTDTDTTGSGSGTNTGSTKSADTTGAPTGSASTPSAPPPPPPAVGKWMQANGQDCVAFCTQAGKTNVASAEGAKCTSGENIPASAIAAGITYSSCFPSCNAHLASNGSPISDGKYCYSTGQKHDDDSSDVTRGCFCK